ITSSEACSYFKRVNSSSPQLICTFFAPNAYASFAKIRTKSAPSFGALTTTASSCCTFTPFSNTSLAYLVNTSVLCILLFLSQISLFRKSLPYVVILFFVRYDIFFFVLPLQISSFPVLSLDILSVQRQVVHLLQKLQKLEMLLHKQIALPLVTLL